MTGGDYREQVRPTIEHFPNLHEWIFAELSGRTILVNRGCHGDYEVFDSLCFHGGRGFALEMRIFGKADLEQKLAAAGFEFEFAGDAVPKWGICWRSPWGLPVVARKRK